MTSWNPNILGLWTAMTVGLMTIPKKMLTSIWPSKLTMAHISHAQKMATRCETARRDLHWIGMSMGCHWDLRSLTGRIKKPLMSCGCQCDFEKGSNGDLMGYSGIWQLLDHGWWPFHGDNVFFLRLDGIGIGAICDATWYVSPGEQRNQRFLPMSDIVPCTNLAWQSKKECSLPGRH